MFSEMIDVDDDEVLLTLDGMATALVGECSTWDHGQRVTRLIYDASVILRILMDRDGMSYDDAREFVSFNIEDAYVGPSTPILMWHCEMLDEGEVPTH